jgi:hypothetical protein
MITILKKIPNIPSFQYSIIPPNLLNTNVVENSILPILFKNYDAHHWLPKPFCSPQSGHVQVIALHDIPHMFSCMQFWQILNPQRHVQQKVNVILQQSHS